MGSFTVRDESSDQPAAVTEVTRVLTYAMSADPFTSNDLREMMNDYAQRLGADLAGATIHVRMNPESSLAEFTITSITVPGR